MADENNNGLALKSRDGYTGKLFLPSTADIATLNQVQTSVNSIDPTARFIVSSTEPETADDGKIWIMPEGGWVANALESGKAIHDLFYYFYDWCFEGYYPSVGYFADLYEDTTKSVAIKKVDGTYVGKLIFYMRMVEDTPLAKNNGFSLLIEFYAKGATSPALECDSDFAKVIRDFLNPLGTKFVTLGIYDADDAASFKEGLGILQAGGVS